MNHDARALAWYRRGIVAAGVVTLLMGAHALAATPPTIGIKEFKYGPSMLTVPAGTTVTWVNHDEEPHTAHIRDGRLQLRRARERRYVRADLYKTRHLPVLLRDSSLHEGHVGREVDATEGHGGRHGPV